MSYKIIEIEGIGDSYADKLENVGIYTTEELLQHTATHGDRKKLAKATGIDESLILKWAKQADLFRIKGISGQFAELLEATGVDTVPEFSHRTAEHLHPKLEAVNEEKHLCRRIPDEEELGEMIGQAKYLDPAVTL